MTDELNQSIQILTKLVEQSHNKRLLWEEMQLISQKAFEVQDRIMAILDQTEATETDVVKVQAAFAARESIWDLMRQITDREQEIKEKTHTKETPAERAHRHKEIMAEAHKHTHSCGCGCGHSHHDETCCHKKGKTCKKKSVN